MVAAGMQPLPPLHPGTKERVTPDLLAPLFPESLIMQEVSTDQWIDIPGPILDVYRLWRPTPLYRARRLEQALQTPAHIYFKYEGTSPAGSHKPNTAVAQAYYNKEAGTKRLATETGAGQWGPAMDLAGEYPDVVIGCVGGGSNYSGLAYPFMQDRLAGKSKARFLACEPAACPTLTKGTFAYDFGDTGQTTPLFPMYTIGHSFVP